MSAKRASPKSNLVKTAPSTEDALKNPTSSLFFFQGREVELRVHDAYSILEAVRGKSDEERLTYLKHLEGMSLSLRNPRLIIYTVEEKLEFDDDMNLQTRTEKRETNVKLERRPGAYIFSVPDLYPNDGPKRYEVCGVTHNERSFTKDEHDAWEKFSDERELSKNLAKQSEIRRKVGEKLPSDEDVESMRRQLPQLRKAQNKLYDKQREAYLDLDLTTEQVEAVNARVKLTDTRIKEIDTELKKWGSQDVNDPFSQALATSPLRKDLQEWTDAWNVAFLEFVHKLSVDQGLTDEAFDLWLERAQADDYANAIVLVTEGNAFWTYGKAATPISREDDQKREFKKLLN